MLFLGSPFAFCYCLIVARRQANRLAAKIALILSAVQGAAVVLLVLNVLPVLLGLV